MDKENPIHDQDLLKKINQKLERKTKEVEIIQQVSSQINATLNLQNIANTMLELMDEFFGFKHTMILYMIIMIVFIILVGMNLRLLVEVIIFIMNLQLIQMN